MSDRRLDSAFCRYLGDPQDKAMVEVLVHLLRDHAYAEEAELLYQHQFNRPESVILQGNPWQGGKCFLGDKPPPLTSDPMFWFDPIECTLMRSCLPLEDVSADMAAWISVRPVQRWQFRGFLLSAEIGRRPGSLPFATDAFLKGRFTEDDSQLPQTDVYEEEAWAYAAWFGKTLTGQFQWEALSERLDESQLNYLFDKSLHFWELGDFRESFRLAYSQQSLTLDPIEQADCLEEDGIIPDESRVVYREHERRSTIGFSTCVFANRGLTRQAPRSSEYHELKNQAFRLIL